MAKKGYSLGSLTDYVNTKFDIAGGEITGQVRLTTNFPSTTNQAQIFHDVKGVTGEYSNLRSMRENDAAAWVWEKLASGVLSYSTGVKGDGAATISFNVNAGSIASIGSIKGSLLVSESGEDATVRARHKTTEKSVQLASRKDGLQTLDIYSPTWGWQTPLVFDDTGVVAANYDMRVRGATFRMQRDGRRHITFANAAGDIDGYLYKDFEDDWRLNHGEAHSELTWSRDGELTVDGARWAVTHAHGYANQPGTKAPVHVDFGVVNGNDDYYPILRGVTSSEGYGYTTFADFGMIRNGGNQWGRAVIYVGSFESPDHPYALYTFTNEGDFTAGRNGSFNDVYIRSDERLKSDKVPLSGALDKVCTLQGYTYTKHKSLTDNTAVGREAGILAQDLEKVLPEATYTDEDTQMTISNSGVNALLVEAVKELRAEVMELRALLEVK